jgi:glycosyltransferase involved in cell wall biosynthesis
MKKKRFAYLSAENPEDKKVWSGTHHSIFNVLKSIGEVEVLGPYKPGLRLFFARLLNQFYLRVLKKRISYRHSSFISKGYANYFTKKLKGKQFDFIIAPAASLEIAYLDTTIPIIYITDGTFSGCLNYHKNLTNLTKKSIIDGNYIEQAAIEKSKFVIVSSEWAANSVANNYHKNTSAIKVIPYGANFELLPQKSELDFIAPKFWKLLFVGVYWDNKGGDIAFHAFKQLHDKGYQVSLTVVGCIPPKEVRHHNLSVIPFIDKNEKAGREKLFSLFLEHHLLVLPTRFDCTPIVINEASAFAIPSLIANSGGVAGHLKDGKNGFLINYADMGEGYAAKIEALINTPEAYVELRRKTYELSIEELNWDARV